MPRVLSDPDSAAVRFDDALDDGQSQARTAAACLLRLPKAIEDVRQMVDRDSGPGVLDPEEHFLTA